MKYFSKTSGFYDSTVHDTIPQGAVSITEEEWKNLIDGQANGKRIVFNDSGYPYLEDIADTRTYAEKRRLEYPPIEDYLDGVVKGDQEQIDKYIIDCLAIKQKYPKP